MSVRKVMAYRIPKVSDPAELVRSTTDPAVAVRVGHVREVVTSTATPAFRLQACGVGMPGGRAVTARRLLRYGRISLAGEYALGEGRQSMTHFRKLAETFKNRSVQVPEMFRSPRSRCVRISGYDRIQHGHAGRVVAKGRATPCSGLARLKSSPHGRRPGLAATAEESPVKVANQDMSNQPKPPYRPGDPPPSDDECAGVDRGPCRSFAPMDPPWEHLCRKCGYQHR